MDFLIFDLNHLNLALANEALEVRILNVNFVIGTFVILATKIKISYF